MKREKKVIEVRWLTGAELADMLDLTPGRVSQLTQQGVLERRASDKHYDLALSIASYGRYILAPQLYGPRLYD